MTSTRGGKYSSVTTITTEYKHILSNINIAETWWRVNIWCLYVAPIYFPNGEISILQLFFKADV